MTSIVDTAHVEKLLTNLRDSPVNTEGANDDFLGPIFAYLIKIPANPLDGLIHWFCDHANQLTIEAATFLIRLFAYDSPRVDNWKGKLWSCLEGCSGCVKGLENAKLSSKDTYFGAFSDEVLKGFYHSFNAWELDMVLATLSRAGISPSMQASEPQITLSSAPPAIVYNMVCNLQILRDPRILSIIRGCSPPDPLPGWPADPPPAGILILMLDEVGEVRHWAKSQALKCKIVPMSRATFTGAYITAMDVIAHAVSAGTRSTISLNSAPPVTLNEADGVFNTFSFASDPVDLWSGFCAFLRLVPPEMLTSSADHNSDLRRVVTGHLHDTGPHFLDILRCLLFIIKRLGRGLWQGEGPEFPQIVFDAVKDNPSYSHLIQEIDPVGEKPWFLSWFSEYLQSVRELQVYGDVLAKMVDFMCEELQHERFKEARPIIMIAVTRLLSSTIRKVQSEDSSRQSLAVGGVLDIHAHIFVSVAFGHSYNDPKWTNARVAARELITTTLVKDIKNVSDAIIRLCRLMAGREKSAPPCSIRQQIWTKSYASLQTNDSDGISAIISIIAPSAHLDSLNSNAFSPLLQKADGSKAPTSAELSFNAVNSALTVVRAGFLDAISKYANYNASSSVLDLLQRPGVLKNVTLLMLSPVEDIQVAAQTLVGQAFDVDVRLDCFRALLENFPTAALDGIFEFLDTFIQYSPLVPEACNLSKSLVRCLTDVIEVLCAGHDGLLNSERFLKATDRGGPASALLKFWDLMSKSITVIFKRTPAWSIYCENEAMIVWMRDALIFARDMLAQRRVFERAAVLSAEISPAEGTKPQKSSRIGRKMVNDLQDVLPELARWLRLTDEELLHQSFALLQSLLECFRESHVLPLPGGVARLAKQIDDARKKGSSREGTRLDSARLSKLEDALAAFDNDENDDVQIISHTKPPLKSNHTDRQPSDSKTNSSTINSRKVSLVDNRKSALIPSKMQNDRPASKVKFTGQDQRRLNAQVSLPTFRRQEKLPTLNASKNRSQKPVDNGSSSAGLSKRSDDSSSSAESDSEGEEGPQKGLAALAKFQRSPKIRKPTERRQVKMLDVPANGKAFDNRLNQRNDSRRTALRLKPDISGLHRAIMSWDYDHTGPEPPSAGEKLKLVGVPDKFADHHGYRNIFEPLLLLECWSQITKSKEEKQEVCDCKISSRQFVDDWVDLDLTISEPVPKDWYLAETDIILLRHLDSQRSTLAKVRNYKALPTGIQATIRARSKGDPGLVINSAWRLSKVFSLSTIHREYAALMALPYYDLFQRILQPHLSPKPAIDPRDIKQTMITQKVNEPQAVAILASLQADGFALVQGPPGTGKTSTICGLVKTFLSRRLAPATALHIGRNSGPVDREPPKKILLCAPSNAAIDEVTHRLKDIRNNSGTPMKVVRIGTDKAINISVKDVSLDFLVEQKLNANPGQGNALKDAGNETVNVRSEIEAVKRLKQQKQEELSNVHDNASRTLALEDEIRKLNSRRMALTQQFDKLKDKKKHEYRSLDATRRKFRSEVLHEADVICATLSGAGHETLEEFNFEMIIIDEAAQAIELSSLIPLKFRCQRCIMVGDPQQLPPTVLSQEACKFLYNQSLFVRLQKHHPEAVHLLSIQYRMHPHISELPSRMFYQGRLQDGPGMASKTEQPWHSHPKFGTYRFFNVSNGREEQAASGHSLKNKVECQVAVALYARICKEFSDIDLNFRVGVVSMYRGQILELQRSFEQRFGRDILGTVHFSTVDGFQGQEKDIIILSCVRAGPGIQNIGFLSDARRMNVALTRARSSLFILGHAPTLERSDNNWRQIVQDARSRMFMSETDVSFFTSPSGTLPRAPPHSQSSQMLPVVADPAFPLDLVKPRDLMAVASQSPSVGLANAQRSMGADDDKLPGSPELPPTTDEREPKAGHKRPAVNHPSQPSGDTRSAPPYEKRPQGPPVKRQKKEKGSIFIPKKPNKRPAPEGDSAGPSNIRRHL